MALMQVGGLGYMTFSIFMALVFRQKLFISQKLMVQEALGLTFPYMHLFMPIFLFLLGYSTILAYFVVGVKCAKFLSPKWGPLVYYAYACVALPVFAFVDSTQAFVVMSLLLFNVIGMFLLRKEVRFDLT